jgi:enamine deaminase RidA (YjgF/YER057c/UK114 family)
MGLRLLGLTQSMAGTLDAAMRDQADPDALDALYQLDAFVHQTRRHAENLVVLSGQLPMDHDRQVTSLSDLIQAAMSRIPAWHRVSIGRVADIAVVEYVSGDLIRVMTELLDNAARYSPPSAPITVSGHLLHDGGVLLRIEDTGIGIAAEDLAALNAVLRTSNPTVPLTANGGSVRQGLQVVQRAVSPHGVETSLTARVPHGTTAHVYVPARLLCEIPTGEPVARTAPPEPSATIRYEHSTVVPTVSRAPEARPVADGRLPIREPQSMRSGLPEPAPARRWPTDGQDALADLVAFDAATREMPASSGSEGPTNVNA